MWGKTKVLTSITLTSIGRNEANGLKLSIPSDSEMFGPPEVLVHDETQGFDFFKVCEFECLEVVARFKFERGLLYPITMT